MSLVQDVPVVHVCLVVPASEVRTMHSKQPCFWNVSRVPREQVGGNTMVANSTTHTVHPICGLMGVVYIKCVCLCVSESVYVVCLKQNTM